MSFLPVGPSLKSQPGTGPHSLTVLPSFPSFVPFIPTPPPSPHSNGFIGKDNVHLLYFCLPLYLPTCSPLSLSDPTNAPLSLSLSLSLARALALALALALSPPSLSPLASSELNEASSPLCWSDPLPEETKWIVEKVESKQGTERERKRERERERRQLGLGDNPKHGQSNSVVLTAFLERKVDELHVITRTTATNVALPAVCESSSLFPLLHEGLKPFRRMTAERSH